MLTKESRKYVAQMATEQLRALIRAGSLSEVRPFGKNCLFSEVQFSGIGRAGLDVVFQKAPKPIHVQVHLRGHHPDPAAFRTLIELVERTLDADGLLPEDKADRNGGDSLVRWELPWPADLKDVPSDEALASFAARYLSHLGTRLGSRAA